MDKKSPAKVLVEGSKKNLDKAKELEKALREAAEKKLRHEQVIAQPEWVELPARAN